MIDDKWCNAWWGGNDAHHRLHDDAAVARHYDIPSIARRDVDVSTGRGPTRGPLSIAACVMCSVHSALFTINKFVAKLRDLTANMIASQPFVDFNRQYAIFKLSLRIQIMFSES